MGLTGYFCVCAKAADAKVPHTISPRKIFVREIRIAGSIK